VGPLSLSEEGVATFALVTAKASIGAVGAVLLGATTSVPDILHGLERLRVPRLLTVIAAFMYRYVFVIADELRRMRLALTARAYRPRHAAQVAALGRMVTALFLRSYERGERVYLAMLARGYGGAMPRLGVLAFRRADAAFLAALGLTLVPLRVLAEAAA
jgi:cobalt/nickel transport system permease protein